jgi:hypothetical protein
MRRQGELMRREKARDGFKGPNERQESRIRRQTRMSKIHCTVFTVNFAASL